MTADERTRRRRLAQSKVWRQRRLAAPQRDPLQPALGLQARRPTRGISYRQTQTATLLAAQHRRQGRPPCPRDPPALHQGDRSSPRRSAANPLRPQTPRLSRGLRAAVHLLPSGQIDILVLIEILAITLGCDVIIPGRNIAIEHPAIGDRPEIAAV